MTLAGKTGGEKVGRWRLIFYFNRRLVFKHPQTLGPVIKFPEGGQKNRSNDWSVSLNPSYRNRIPGKMIEVINRSVQWVNQPITGRQFLPGAKAIKTGFLGDDDGLRTTLTQGFDNFLLGVLINLGGDITK